MASMKMTLNPVEVGDIIGRTPRKGERSLGSGKSLPET